MKLKSAMFSVLVLFVFAGAFAWKSGGSNSHPALPYTAAVERLEASEPNVEGRVPVLVELFTSEGCSSCPPADALIARLVKTQPIEGVQVIALKQHVDYWNRLGWKDRFSSELFTERQNLYAVRFGNNSVYTPQMVVDGLEEFVGSDEARARRAIKAAAQKPKAAIKLEWQHPKGDPNFRQSLKVTISPPAAPPGESVLLMFALIEDAIHSEIRGGENAGKAIDHFGVVRSLEDMQHFSEDKISSTKDISLSIDLTRIRASDLTPMNLRAVVFLQGERSGRIFAAGSVPYSQPQP